MILHDYWRSTASYRVRIALNLKGVAYRQEPHDLRTGAHRDAAYRARNPQALVPALDIGGRVIAQSAAIIEWLDAAHPKPPLLPADPADAAVVRAIAGMIGADIHPLNNLRVLDTLRRDFSASQDQVAAWMGRWMTEGFAAIELLIERHGDGFAFGDLPSMADCYLIPQVYSAERFAIDLSAFPRIASATQKARDLAPFAAAHPALQPDAD